MSIDLEVEPKSNKNHNFAGVCSGFDRGLVFNDAVLVAALQSLDPFAEITEFILAHNLINFDARLLEAAKPDLQRLKKPMIDRRWLNSRAFLRNPYHHLVKHDQEGRLQTGHVNTPE